MAGGSRRGLLRAMGGLIPLAAGCAGPSVAGDSPTVSPPPLPADGSYAYTHIQPSGNRVVSGDGAVQRATPVDVPIEGTPAWVLAIADSPASLWTVVTAEGAARTVRIADGAAETIDEPAPLPAGMPPLGRAADGTVSLARPAPDGSRLSHPVATPAGPLYIDNEGRLALADDGATTRFDIDAPPDARIVQIDGTRFATLGGATERYTHGALGDTIEGGSVVVVDVGRSQVVTNRVIDPPAVVEGLSPLVADLDGDGDPELVATTATGAAGARLEAFTPGGTSLARGPAIGDGGWRHQLCVAPFAPDGAPEIAAVRKPHVDHRLEFYRYDEDRLRVTARLSGIRTHTYGSRNLDGALGADFDGDGRVELLVPRTDRRRLLAVERGADGAAVDWNLPLGGELVSNLAGVSLRSGIAVGAATPNRLRVWPA